MTEAADAVVQRLREAGLYDPDADDAGERLKLLRFNLDQGVTVDELVEAERLGRLHYVGGDPHIRPSGVPLTLAELAERAGVDEVEVTRIWRSAGLVDPGCGAITLSEADIEVMDVVRAVGTVFDQKVTLQLIRTIGAALARVAEAEVTAFTTIVGGDLVDKADALELARANVGITQLLPQLAKVLDVLHRHHIQSSICRLMSDASTRESQTKPLTVGFADLVGFTAWSARSDLGSLASLVADFEARARDAVTGCGARVVKMIGDEVMFVAGDPVSGCRVSQALIAEAAQLEALPQIRVGLAYGDVLTGYGDYYGPVVNLAARLVSTAEPGQVLVSAEVPEHAPDLVFRRAGTRALKGLAVPVQTYELTDSSP